MDSDLPSFLTQQSPPAYRLGSLHFNPYQFLTATKTQLTTALTPLFTYLKQYRILPPEICDASLTILTDPDKTTAYQFVQRLLLEHNGLLWPLRISPQRNPEALAGFQVLTFILQAGRNADQFASPFSLFLNTPPHAPHSTLTTLLERALLLSPYFETHLPEESRSYKRHQLAYSLLHLPPDLLTQINRRTLQTLSFEPNTNHPIFWISHGFHTRNQIFRFPLGTIETLLADVLPQLPAHLRLTPLDLIQSNSHTVLS